MDMPIGFEHLASLNHALALQVIEIPALGITRSIRNDVCSSYSPSKLERLRRKRTRRECVRFSI